MPLLEALEPRVLMSVSVGSPVLIQPPSVYDRQADGGTELTISGDAGIVVFTSDADVVIVPDGPAYGPTAFFNVAQQQFVAIDAGSQFVIDYGDTNADGSLIALETFNISFLPTILLYDSVNGEVLVEDLLSHIGDPDLIGIFEPSLSDNGQFISFTGSKVSEPDVIYRYDLVNDELITVSLTTLGAMPDASSRESQISGDGRFVVFESDANLVDGDMPAASSNVYLYDHQAGYVIRVSPDDVDGQTSFFNRAAALSDDGNVIVYEAIFASYQHIVMIDISNEISDIISLSTINEPGNGDSSTPSISADGRYIAYISDADDLISNDTNAVADVFVYDAQLQTTVRLSAADDESELNGPVMAAEISRDGSTVAYYADATNSVASKPGLRVLMTLVDRVSGAPMGVTLPGMLQGDNDTNVAGLNPISTDGQYIVVESLAGNFIDGDYNAFRDIFRYNAITGEIQRVSNDYLGGDALGDSQNASISRDGRFVVFESYAENLVSGDDNYYGDVFRYDFQTDTTERVSFDSVNMQQANGHSELAAVSDDGRFVAFSSAADNLVPGDSNGFVDVFVKDMQTGIIERVSVSSVGSEADGDNHNGGISSDGRFVVFTSNATNLDPNDSSGGTDVYLYDRQTDTLTLVSRNQQSAGGNGNSRLPRISGDGRWIVFESDADDLVPDDGNLSTDIFVYDRVNDSLERVSVPAEGGEADGASDTASISDDGRFVSFYSSAGNLLDGTFGGAYVVDRLDGSLAYGGIVNNRIVVSPDGSLVVLDTFVSLDAGDTNFRDDVYFATLSDSSSTLPPDLVGSFGEVPLSSFNPGQTRTVPFYLSNIGNGPAIATSSTRVEFYLSSDETLDGSDTLVRSVAPIKIGAVLDPDEQTLLNASITVPSSFTPGTYYLIAVIDPAGSLNESDTSNNTETRTIEVEYSFGQGEDGKQQKLTITDEDGTIVTFQLGGGGSAQAIPGDGYYDLVITGSTNKSTLKINAKNSGADGDDGLVTIRNIQLGEGDEEGLVPLAAGAWAGNAWAAPAADAAATLNKMLAKAARLIGTLDASSGLKSLQLGSADGATINIAATDNPADTVTLNIITAKNLSVNSQLPIKSLTTARWLDDDGSADAISAPWIGAVKVTGNSSLGLVGDFQADITTTTPQASGVSLGAVSVAGTISAATWSIAGIASGIKVGAIASTFTGTFGTLSKLAVNGNAAGSLTAAALPSVAIKGNWTDATVRLSSDAVSAAKIAVSGSVQNLDFRAAGSVTQFTASSLLDSLIFLGVDDEVDALPNTAADLANNQATLGKLTLTGSVDSQFSGSSIAAAVMGSINLKLVDTAGDASGVAAASIGSLARIVNGSNVTLSDLGAGDSLTDGQFTLRMLE